MEHETTTPTASEPATIQGVPVDSNDQPIVQAEESPAPVEAVKETTQPESESQSEASEPSDDEQLIEFARNKGLELDSENAKKAAKMAMNAEKAFHAKSQRASQLEKTFTQMSDESAEQVAYNTGQNPELLKRLQQIEVKESIRNFFDNNPDARNYEEQMAKIAVESGLYGSPESILQASYAIAKSQDTDSIKSKAKRETLENLAHKQQASVPRGAATTSEFSSDTTITKANVDKLVAANDQKWFEAHYDEINRALAS